MIDPKDLEDGAHDIVEFPFTGGERGDAERMVAKLEDGRWLTAKHRGL